MRAKCSDNQPCLHVHITTRTRRNWKPDSRGYYTRQIGWVVSKSGKNQQQKFLLGKDLNAAETRERKLRELWDRHASQQQQRRPLWPDDLLEIGKLIARGVEEIAVPHKRRASLKLAKRVESEPFKRLTRWFFSCQLTATYTMLVVLHCTNWTKSLGNCQAWLPSKRCSNHFPVSCPNQHWATLLLLRRLKCPFQSITKLF